MKFAFSSSQLSFKNYPHIKHMLDVLIKINDSISFLLLSPMHFIHTQNLLQSILKAQDDEFYRLKHAKI